MTASTDGQGPDMNTAIRKTYWQLTALLLTAHLAGWPWALACVLALNAIQALHFLLWHRNLRNLEVQVRLLYLALLVLGASVPGLHWILVLQTAGLAVRLSVEYCLAARLMVLMPWNRNAPLSAGLVRRVFLTPPGPGQIQVRLGLSGVEVGRPRANPAAAD